MLKVTEKAWNVITVVAVLPEIVDITTTLTSTFIALFYRLVMFDIKIKIIVVMTVIFVMVVYTIMVVT